MEITQGNLANLYTGLRGTFREAVQQAKMPGGILPFVMEDASTTSKEDYPTGVLLGDIEEMLDEYVEINIGKFKQTVENRFYGAIIPIPKANVEEDTLGMFRTMAATFGRQCATKPYRQVPRLFIDGFATAWGPDGANVWSSSHAWPGGQAWDNLDAQPLTHQGYRTVRQHLVERVGPDNQPLDLVPTHLICGESNRTAAKGVLAAEYAAGGASNRDRDESVEIVIWSRLQGAYSHYWFLVDAEAFKPVVILNREAPALTSRTDPEDSNVFKREVFEYKAARRYGLAVVAPWLVQAVLWTGDSTTTTAAA